MRLPSGIVVQLDAQSQSMLAVVVPTLPAMESEAQAGSPRQASARACRRRRDPERGGRGCPVSHPEHGDTPKGTTPHVLLAT